ncbi:Putative phosphatase/kinase [Mycobacteroides abscessus subsp. massiliense]|nr:Putative phosphatase/kinase [Mycobacteroides abscessus subsp. massiliense]
MYLLSGCDELQIADLRTQLDGMGDSIAIAGDGDMGYSVHAHVNDAGAAIEAGMKFGTPQSTMDGTGIAGYWRWPRATARPHSSPARVRRSCASTNLRRVPNVSSTR